MRWLFRVAVLLAVSVPLVAPELSCAQLFLPLDQSPSATPDASPLPELAPVESSPATAAPPMDAPIPPSGGTLQAPAVGAPKPGIMSRLDKQRPSIHDYFIRRSDWVLVLADGIEGPLLEEFAGLFESANARHRLKVFLIVKRANCPPHVVNTLLEDLNRELVNSRGLGGILVLDLDDLNPVWNPSPLIQKSDWDEELNRDLGNQVLNARNAGDAVKVAQLSLQSIARRLVAERQNGGRGWAGISLGVWGLMMCGGVILVFLCLWIIYYHRGQQIFIAKFRLPESPETKPRLGGTQCGGLGATIRFDRKEGPWQDLEDGS